MDAKDQSWPTGLSVLTPERGGQNTPQVSVKLSLGMSYKEEGSRFSESLFLPGTSLKGLGSLDEAVLSQAGLGPESRSQPLGLPLGTCDLPGHRGISSRNRGWPCRPVGGSGSAGSTQRETRGSCRSLA